MSVIQDPAELHTLSKQPLQARQVAYPALDGLRCYAALLVFLVHLAGGLLTEYYRVPVGEISTLSPISGIAFLAFLGDGHHGVDIFFLISGFLMARVARPGMKWTTFVGRRWLRIYPAFLASLVLTTTVYVTAYDWPFQLRDFMLNLVFYNSLPNHGIIPYNHVTWSLGYEFAFYLVVPLLMLSRSPRTRAAVALAAMLAAVLLLPSLAMRISGLFAGFALGCASDTSLRRLADRVPVSLVVVAYCALVWAKAFVPLGYREFHHALLPVAALLIVCIVFGSNPLTRFFASRPMRVLGQWSYSIYLLHPLILSLVLYQLLDWTALRAHPAFAVPFVCLAAVVLTVAAAAVSYTLFEAPYFKRRRSGHGDKTRPGAQAANQVA